MWGEFRRAKASLNALTTLQLKRFRWTVLLQIRTVMTNLRLFWCYSFMLIWYWYNVFKVENIWRGKGPMSWSNYRFEGLHLFFCLCVEVHCTINRHPLQLDSYHTQRLQGLQHPWMQSSTTVIIEKEKTNFENYRGKKLLKQ